VALFYADSSAVMKFLGHEPESPALRRFLDGADLVSCELALVEVPRAIRRAAATDPRLPLDPLLERAAGLLETVGLLPIDGPMLVAAGALEEPALRALDAIHIAAAKDAAPVDAFVSYDERQAAAARLVGLRTVAPL
jgi:predicted nucleic acid-binding protein